MPKTLIDLISALPRAQVIGTHGDPGTAITAPVVESDAEVLPGGVFVARHGVSPAGHTVSRAAIERGAAAIVGEHDLSDLPVPYVRVHNALEATGWLAAAYHDFPARRLVITGVTGTDGKTTTSTLVHAILKHALGKAGLISTVNADLGDTVADTGLHVTTPGAPQVQALLARMVANGLTHAVVEMTSHGLAQGRLNGVDVDVAILTNLRHEHLDYHGSFESYRAAKGRLFQMLSKSRRKAKQHKVSIINADDANSDFFAEFAADRVIRYGLSEAAEYRAVDVHYSAHGTSFRVEYPDDYVIGTTVSDVEFFTPLRGVFNVYNALAAVEACIAMPVSIRSVIEGLRQVESIPGRMERIDEGQPFTAIVDFAHTPNALENALTACRELLPEGRRLIAVFGSAGLRDREKRRMMAEIGVALADVVILTAEDPRTESLDAILAAMAAACVERGGVEGETFLRVPDRGQALFRACQLAQPGDIVIACGKGHEQSMCFGTTEYPWDDREAMRAALHGAPLATLPTAGR